MHPYGSDRNAYDRTYREERRLEGKGIKARARRAGKAEIRAALDARTHRHR